MKLRSLKINKIKLRGIDVFEVTNSPLIKSFQELGEFEGFGILVGLGLDQKSFIVELDNYKFSNGDFNSHISFDAVNNN